MLATGTLLNGTYRVIGQIGAGGGGIVYKAYHERLQTYVVVKQIRDQVKGLLNSRAEVDILKNLRNSYLPRVYDFIEDDGEIYTVMEFIDGESLDKVLARDGAMSQQEVLKWARQLADALAYLHSRTPVIIHSDIKPANIMLTSQRDICLIDFNVSLLFDHDMRRSTGISKGYSPPEQYPGRAMYCQMVGGKAAPVKAPVMHAAPAKYDPQGETELLPESRASRNDVDATELLSATEILPGTQMTQETEPAASGQAMRATEAVPDAQISQLTESLLGKGIDERSDIYSLGATLYHLLTGKYPADNFDAIVPLHAYKNVASEGLCTIVDKMMEIDPGKRYQNGMELAAAFADIYKLDSIYRNYHRRTRLMTVGLVASYLVAAGLIVSGMRTIEREESNAYYDLIAQADESLNQGAYEAAEEALASAMESKPERIETYERKALSLYQQGQYEECVSYGLAVVNSPAYTLETQTDKELYGDLLYVIGNAYYSQGDYSNALQMFQEALNYRTDNSAYYSDLAITYAKTGNLDQANAILSQSEALGLTEDSIYLIEGETAYAGGEPQRAADLARQTLSISETKATQVRGILLYIKACSDVGDVSADSLSYIGQWDQRLGDMQVTERLAELYAQQGDYSSALELMQALRNKGYVTFQLLENIAVLYQQMDELTLAQETLTQMEEAYPERYEVWMWQCYLDADVEQHKDVTERSYTQLQAHYEQAASLYESSGETDSEMQQLEVMVQELQDGGWFD